MSFTRSVSTNNYGPAKFIVDGTTVANGTHSTIAAALSAASSNDTIVIRPGTYTENISLKKGVNLVAFSGTDSGQVTIKGKTGFTGGGSGNIYLTGINFETNSDYLFEITTNGTNPNFYFTDCGFNILTTGGFNLTGTGAGVNLVFQSCSGTIGTTGVKFANTTAGLYNFNFYNTRITNSGNSTTLSTITSSNFTARNSYFETGFSLTGCTSIIYGCQFYNPTNNITALTTVTSGTLDVSNTYIYSGTAASISVGASTTVSAFENIIESTNANPFTGAGTMNHAGNAFTSTGQTSNVTTSTARILRPGVVRSVEQPLFTALNTIVSDVTGDGTTYAMIFGTEVTDQGANYNNATGVFTAPYTGNYIFTVSVVVGGLTASHTSGSIRLVTTARTITLDASNYGAIRNASNIITVHGSVIVPMTATDTAYADITVSGSTKVVDFNANGYFTGTMLN